MFAELTAVTATAGWASSTTLAAVWHRRLHTDEVTGIGNRAALYRRARRDRRRDLVGLLMVDLDSFKTINDRYGHPFGNRLLAAVAARLDSLARREELAVRLHGDEFALWLGQTSPARAEQRRQDVTAALAEPWSVQGQRLTVSGSVGLAVGAGNAALGDLLGEADRDLYRVKAARHVATLPTRSRRPRDLPPHPAA